MPTISPTRAASAAILLFLCLGCRKVEAPPPPPPPEVLVATPTQRDVTVYQDFTGNTKAIESVEIRARVQGFLESFNFEPGKYSRTLL